MLLTTTTGGPRAPISAGEKVALVFMRSNMQDEHMPESRDLGDGLSCHLKSPVQLDSRWREWIGSIRVSEVEGATLVLAARGDADNVTVLDGEDEQLRRRVQRLYSSLLISGPVRCARSPLLISAQHWGVEGLHVRQFSQLSKPEVLPGTPRSDIDAARLRRAALYATTLEGLLPGGQHARLMRSLRSFIAGVETLDASERLHSFARALEGFILPSAGNTKRQFKSRTELFIGPRHHQLMDETYELRSAAEHLHDPYSLVSGTTERDRRVSFLKSALACESIARHCAQRILESPDVLACFESEAALAQFWSLPRQRRQEIWGDPLDLSAYQALTKWSRVSDRALGLEQA